MRMAFIITAALGLFGPPELPAEPIAHTVNREGHHLFRVEGFHVSPEQAYANALQRAQQVLTAHLLALKHPVHIGPSVDQVKKMVIHRYRPSEFPATAGTSRAPEAAAVKISKFYKCTIDIELKPEIVRKLRAEDRLRRALWPIVCLAIFGLMMFLLARLDTWTRGYWAPAVGPVLAVMALAAALIWAIKGWEV